MFTEALAMGSGGGSAEWITPELSNGDKTATCTWDYDADSLIVMYRTSTFRAIHLYDLALATLWYSNSTAAWQSYSPINWMTFTSRSLTWNCPQNVPILEISVIPLKGKPNGYFA